MGKSALAAEAIWTLAPGDTPPERFPDGLVMHEFYRHPQAAVALEAIARAYGEEPSPTPEAAARRALASRQALVLLDGTEAADDLRAVLDVCGGCGVLVTSRKSDDAAGDWQDVRPLSTTEAVDLLGAWAGRQAKDKVAAKAICELVGGLPLAVQLVGRYLAQRRQHAKRYLEWLRALPLEALDQGKRREKSVPLLLERSLAQVSEAACDALSVVGVLALAPFDGSAVAQALEVPAFRAEDMLGELVSYGLLLRPEERYEMSHALIHTYARERCPAAEGVVGRLAAHYTAIAEEQSALEAEGYARLDLERAHVMQVAAACAAREAWHEVLDLVEGVQDYFRYQGHWTELRTALQHSLVAAGELGNRTAEANCIKALGDVHRMLAEYGAARERYEEARPIYAQIGDRLGEANCIQALGDVHRMLAEYGAARERYEEARPI